ncbi:hypothetical protein CC78DRAFT_599462 [Lojkania enalia]|uniref:Uncharacterized protein n=1 Tax=Lojkania enalia TaxID=147567 RepID=A0A9P4TR56_9PLEO|nr:hypothetical protein CC78DRAFT_599462 [Didymosphaeria enalia]
MLGAGAGQDKTGKTGGRRKGANERVAQRGASAASTSNLNARGPMSPVPCANHRRRRRSTTTTSSSGPAYYSAATAACVRRRGIACSGCATSSCRSIAARRSRVRPRVWAASCERSGQWAGCARKPPGGRGGRWNRRWSAAAVRRPPPQRPSLSGKAPPLLPESVPRLGYSREPWNASIMAARHIGRAASTREAEGDLRKVQALE